MEIEYNNIRIRNATSKDAIKLCSWWNDGEVMAHAGFPNGLNTSVDEIINSLEQDNDLVRRRFIIEYDNNAIGEMSYRDKGDKVVQIGIKICEKNYQNRGLGRQILSLFIEALFNDLGYDKIILDTDLENKRAQHIYELLGFQKQRVNKDVWKNQIGEWRSSLDYELTRATFKSYLERNEND